MMGASGGLKVTLCSVAGCEDPRRESQKIAETTAKSTIATTKTYRQRTAVTVDADGIEGGNEDGSGS
jgi:hypothetical protein